MIYIKQGKIIELHVRDVSMGELLIMEKVVLGRFTIFVRSRDRNERSCLSHLSQDGAIV